VDIAHVLVVHQQHSRPRPAAFMAAPRRAALQAVLAAAGPSLMRCCQSNPHHPCVCHYSSPFFFKSCRSLSRFRVSRRSHRNSFAHPCPNAAFSAATKVRETPWGELLVTASAPPLARRSMDVGAVFMVCTSDSNSRSTTRARCAGGETSTPCHEPEGAVDVAGLLHGRQGPASFFDARGAREWASAFSRPLLIWPMAEETVPEHHLCFRPRPGPVTAGTRLRPCRGTCTMSIPRSAVLRISISRRVLAAAPGRGIVELPRVRLHVGDQPP